MLGQKDYSRHQITVVDGSENPHLMKVVSAALLPCAAWEVHRLERLLPELALKLRLIGLGERQAVGLGEDVWSVEIEESGGATAVASEGRPDVLLAVTDIGKALQANFAFTTDAAEREKLEKTLSCSEEKCASLQTQNSELAEQLAAIKKAEEQERQRIRAAECAEQEHRKKVSARAKSRLLIINKRATSWAKEHGQFVEEGTILLHGYERCRSSRTGGRFWGLVMECQQGQHEVAIRTMSPRDGRLFILCPELDTAKPGTIVGVISEPSDSLRDIRDWLLMRALEDFDSLTLKVNAWKTRVEEAGPEEATYCVDGSEPFVAALEAGISAEWGKDDASWILNLVRARGYNCRLLPWEWK